MPEPEEDRPSGRQPTKALDMPKLPLSELSKAKEEEKNVFGEFWGEGGGCGLWCGVVRCGAV